MKISPWGGFFLFSITRIANGIVIQFRCGTARHRWNHGRMTTIVTERMLTYDGNGGHFCAHFALVIFSCTRAMGVAIPTQWLVSRTWSRKHPASIKTLLCSLLRKASENQLRIVMLSFPSKGRAKRAFFFKCASLPTIAPSTASDSVYHHPLFRARWPAFYSPPPKLFVVYFFKSIP